VYHSIQVLKTQGYSIRSIAEVLGISKTTVQEYSKLSISEAEQKLSVVRRSSKLDPFEEIYLEKLSSYPKERANKLYRHFVKDHPATSSFIPFAIESLPSSI